MKVSYASSVLAFGLAFVAVACGSKKEDSSLHITPRNTMVLSLSNPLYSEKVQIQTAEVDLGLNAMGRITWAVTADLQLVDFFPKTEMSFAGEYQASNKDVSFSTYKALPVSAQHQVKTIARFTKIMDLQDGSILLQFEHLGTGLSGQATIQEGRNGLVEIMNVSMRTTRAVTMKIADKNSEEGWYQDAAGIWQYGLRRMIGIIADGAVTLNKVD